MRKLVFLLMCLLPFAASAQTLFQFGYVDPIDKVEYSGVMLYSNEYDCAVRFVTDDLIDQGRVYEVAYEYREDEDGFYLVPVKEDDVFPFFLWFYDEDGEMAEKPVVLLPTFDDEEYSGVEAEYFDEIAIQEIDEKNKDFVSIFYFEGEEEYDLLTQGIASADNMSGYGDDYDDYDFSKEDVSDDGYYYEEEEPVKPSPNKPEPVKPSPNKPEPVKPSPNKPEPTKPEPTKPEPVKPEPEKPQLACNLHLIILANTEIGDIGASCKVDLNNIRSEVRGIAKAINATCKEYMVCGESYSKATLQKVISNLKPNANDIIFFAYSGHGFRYDNSTDPYPYLHLCPTEYDDPNDPNNQVALSSIFDEITKKGARLNIVLSDCCNSKMGMNRPVNHGGSLFSRSNNNFDLAKLRTLLLETKGSILATAASAGEYAWCGSQGGYFTLSFIESLRGQISLLAKGEPNWNELITTAKDLALKRTSSGGGSQPQNAVKYVKVSAV